MAERTTIVTEVAQVAEASGNEGVSGSTVQRVLPSLEFGRTPAVTGSVPAGSRPSRSSWRGQHRPDSAADGHQARHRPAPDQPHPADGGEPRRRGDAGAGERPAGPSQAAIWSNVLAGDYRAVMVFLQISQRRAKLNGLDSPASVVISPNVRMEMERALSDLQQVMGMVADDRSD